MDPISLALGVVGLGMQVFGGLGQASASADIARASQDQARQEQSINDLKQKQMEMEARRTQLENIRNNQRARAQAENAAVNQGAQFGTGLLGGLAQINDQSNFYGQGVNSALEIGRGINVFNQNISRDKVAVAGYQGQAATDAGIASLGGAVMKAGPIIGAISKGGFGNPFSGLFGGGSPSNGVG